MISYYAKIEFNSGKSNFYIETWFKASIKSPLRQFILETIWSTGISPTSWFQTASYNRSQSPPHHLFPLHLLPSHNKSSTLTIWQAGKKFHRERTTEPKMRRKMTIIYNLLAMSERWRKIITSQWGKWMFTWKSTTINT